MVTKKTHGCFAVPFLTITGDCAGVSGLVLNRLPGISLRLATDTADEDFVSGINTIRELEKDAIDEVENDLITTLSDRFLFKQAIHSARIGRRSETFTTVSDEVGYLFETTTTKGKKMALWIPFVEIQTGSDVVTTLNVNIDGTVSSESVQLYGDRPNILQIDARAEQFIRISYNPGGVGVGGFNSTGECCFLSCQSCVKVTAQENTAGWIDSGQPNGITADVHCLASACNVFGVFVDQIAHAIRYKVAIKLLEQLLTSRRANPVVANLKESAREQIAKWDGGVDPITGFEREGDYWRQIRMVSDMIYAYLQREYRHEFEKTGARLVESLP